MALGSKNIYGYVEKATLVSKNINLSAKLDTGAKSASLYAVDIEQIEVNGEDYLRFAVPTPAGKILFQEKYDGQVKIKARSGEQKIGVSKKAFTRPVVMMKIAIGNETRLIRVNLADRKRFIYPLLLGRDAIIEFDGLVDPSETFFYTGIQKQRSR